MENTLKGCFKHFYYLICLSKVHVIEVYFLCQEVS